MMTTCPHCGSDNFYKGAVDWTAHDGDEMILITDHLIICVECQTTVALELRTQRYYVAHQVEPKQAQDEN